MQKKILIPLLLVLFIVPNVFAELKEFEVEIDIEIINDTITLKDENGGDRTYVLEDYLGNYEWAFDIFRDVDLVDTASTNSKITNLSNYVSNLNSNIITLKESFDNGQTYFDLYSDCQTREVRCNSSLENIKTCPNEKKDCEEDLYKIKEEESTCSTELQTCQTDEASCSDKLETCKGEEDKLKGQRYLYLVIGFGLGIILHKFLYKQKKTAGNPAKVGRL